ncbi:MAG: hypothetical protein KAY78_06360 [Pseudomonadales bacterium]|jgi:hypothetical protein|nr:hypothetical protein [Cellvibrionales bacterium]MBP8030776.1 hypothetical protein [Pseudomonadales bacterium]
MAHHQAPQNNDCSTTCEEDGCADAFAAVAVIAVVVAAVCFWLNGMA